MSARYGTRVTPLRILLAEDSPLDVMLLREAFADAGVPAEFTHVEDGEDFGKRLAAASGQFSLALTDANLPRKSSLDVLRETVASLGSLPVPVVVLSSFAPDSVMRECESLGVAATLSKPMDPEGFAPLVRLCQRLAGTVAG